MLCPLALLQSDTIAMQLVHGWKVTNLCSDAAVYMMISTSFYSIATEG